jgi:hypothetical protein
MSLLLPGLYHVPKFLVYVQIYVIYDSVYRAPLFAVKFCLSPRGTVNRGSTVISGKLKLLHLEELFRSVRDMLAMIIVAQSFAES